MIWLAAAAVAASPHVSAVPTSGVVVQAQATVRIVAGVRVKLDGTTNSDAPAAHETSVGSTGNGSAQPARLIEFE